MRTILDFAENLSSILFLSPFFLDHLVSEKRKEAVSKSLNWSPLKNRANLTCHLPKIKVNYIRDNFTLENISCLLIKAHFKKKIVRSTIVFRFIMYPNKKSSLRLLIRKSVSDYKIVKNIKW